MFDENDMFENLFAAINVCPKLGDAMFNEDDLFSPLALNDQICYDDCMPPIYDENKVATYDDYGDDMHAIKSNYNHGTFHHAFNVQFDYANQVPHDS